MRMCRLTESTTEIFDKRQLHCKTLIVYSGKANLLYQRHEVKNLPSSQCSLLVPTIVIKNACMQFEYTLECANVP